MTKQTAEALGTNTGLCYCGSVLSSVLQDPQRMGQTLLASPLWDFRVSESFARQSMKIRSRPSPRHKQYRGCSLIHFQARLECIKPLLRARQRVCSISAVMQRLTALPRPARLPLPREHSAPPFAVPQTPQKGYCLFNFFAFTLPSACSALPPDRIPQTPTLP